MCWRRCGLCLSTPWKPLHRQVPTLTLSIGKVWIWGCGTGTGLVTSADLSVSLCSQSAKCKLQLVQLECVGSLAVSLSLPSVTMEIGGVAVMPYLSRDQPHPLQKAASNTFQHMIQLDPHVMWLLLQQMVPPPPSAATPTHPTLKPYKFPSHPDSEKYVENVSPLIALTFNMHES